MNIAPVIVLSRGQNFHPKFSFLGQSNTLSFGLVFTMICPKPKKINFNK
jgi:hypothetical protein